MNRFGLRAIRVYDAIISIAQRTQSIIKRPSPWDVTHSGGRFVSFYSHSTKPNQFCLEIILCRIRGAFEYLMYPYYPAYMG